MLPPQRSVAPRGRLPVQKLHENHRITGDSAGTESFSRAQASLASMASKLPGPRILENTMNRRLIRYKAKPDRADENQRLIEAVPRPRLVVAVGSCAA